MLEFIAHPSFLLFLVLALVLIAEFINGWTDAPNAIATVVSTGSLPVRIALPGAVILNALGAMAGTAVAATIGKGIVATSSVTLPTIGAAMVSIIAWGTLAARRGWPVSKSHALLAGIAGAAIAGGGFQALVFEGWVKVLWGLVASLVIGFSASFLLGTTMIEALVRAPLRTTKRIIDYTHVASAGLMAFAHGMNDGQKFIGIFALVQLLGSGSDDFQISWTVILICSATMGLGTAFGGWRIIATVGKKLGTIESWQGLVATASASSIIIAASQLGIPLSTTHTITSAIAGANSSRGFHHVRWHVMANVMKAWIFTFPCCAIIAFCAAWLVLVVERYL
jgi:PiT family inorganic phosphate transporter